MHPEAIWSWAPFYRLNLLASEAFEDGWELHSIEGFVKFYPMNPILERHRWTGVMQTILAQRN